MICCTRCGAGARCLAGGHDRPGKAKCLSVAGAGPGLRNRLLHRQPVPDQPCGDAALGGGGTGCVAFYGRDHHRQPPVAAGYHVDPWRRAARPVRTAARDHGARGAGGLVDRDGPVPAVYLGDDPAADRHRVLRDDQLDRGPERGRDADERQCRLCRAHDRVGASRRFFRAGPDRRCLRDRRPGGGIPVFRRLGAVRRHRRVLSAAAGDRRICGPDG